MLEPYGLKILGQLVAAAGLFGLVVQPLWQMARFFYLPGRMHKVKRANLSASLAVVTAVVLAVIFCPLPFSVRCTLEVEPRGSEAVFARVPGRLREVVHRPGDSVEAGDVLARLENTDLELAVVALQGERQQLVEQLQNLKRRRFLDERVGMQIPTVEELFATAEKQLAEKQQELERLNVKAPISGQVFPPPYRDSRTEKGRLPGWSGFPYDGKNEGAYLAEKDQLCQIGDPQNFDAILVIDQADIDLLSQYQFKNRRVAGS